jgi:plastocyanin
VQGCLDTDYVDATASTANRTITFGGNLGDVFSPQCLKIAAGQTVTFSGSFSFHPLQETCGPASTISTTSTGSSAMFTFSTAGDYGYECQNHVSLGMVGAIRVQ